MQSEMRRPGPIHIEGFVGALDLQLRDEVPRVRRRALPEMFHRFGRSLRSMLQPIFQSGAIILTSVAVIVAVGAAPASMRTPPPANTPVAAPSGPVLEPAGSTNLRDSLPPDEFLAAGDVFTVQVADNQDIPRMEKE